MAKNFTLNPSDFLQEEQTPRHIPEIFKPYKQSPITDEIRSKLLAPKQLDLTNNASTLASKNKKEMILTIEHYDELEAFLGGENKITSAEVSAKLISAGKLFDCIILTFSQYYFEHGQTIPPGNLELSLPLREYAELIGKKDLRETRENVKRDLTILRNVKFTSPAIQQKGKRLGNDYHDIYLLTEKGISKGNINVTINERFVNILLEQKTHLAFNLNALRINSRQHPNSYLLYTKLQSHRRINLNKETENIISVEALYNYCTTLPRYEKVMSEDRHIDQRIITPFERDLHAIKEIQWHYIGEQPNNFEEWINKKIEIVWLEEYPNQETILKGREKHAKQISSGNK